MPKFYIFDYRTKNSKIDKEFVFLYRKNTAAYEASRFLISDGYTNDFTQYEIDIPQKSFTKSLNPRDKNKIIVATEENKDILFNEKMKYLKFSKGIDFTKVKFHISGLDLRDVLFLKDLKNLKITKKIIKHTESKTLSTKAFIKTLRNTRGAYASDPILERLDNLDVLLVRQKSEFDKIYNELKRERKKVNHWSWWVWPTEKKGKEEPAIKGVKSSIEKNKIPDLLEKTDIKKWTMILNLINKLIEENKSLNKTIPTIDHNRMKAFFNLFLNNRVKGYKNFFEAVKRQEDLFHIY